MGRNPTHGVTRFTSPFPGTHLTTSMPVTCDLGRNFVRFTPVCMTKVVKASVGTLTESSHTCAYLCQAFSDLCRSASFQGFIADSNWPLFIVLKPVIMRSLQ
jgi:hypothetical protein